MNKFLVVSYDSDQQQWFYDTVIAENEEKASELICRIRPYVIDADATNLEEIKSIAKHMEKRKVTEIRASLRSIEKESNVE
jgi:hypothetical protein